MAATYTIFNQSPTSATTRVSTTDGISAYNLGTEFVVTTKCWVVGFAFRRPDTVAQTVTGQLFNMGTSDGTAWTTWISATTFSLGTTSGWKTVMLAAPVRLDYNTTFAYRNRFRVSIRATRFYETNNYWTTGAGSSGFTTPLFTVPNKTNAFNNCQCCHSVTAGAVPDIPSGSGQNWYSDVLISDVDPRMKSNAITVFGGD